MKKMLFPLEIKQGGIWRISHVVINIVYQYKTFFSISPDGEVKGFQRQPLEQANETILIMNLEKYWMTRMLFPLEKILEAFEESV